MSLSTETARNLIAVFVAGAFVVVTGIIIVYPVVANTGMTIADWMQYVGTGSGVYSGIVGAIVGFYFGERRAVIQSGERL